MDGTFPCGNLMSRVELARKNVDSRGVISRARTPAIPWGRESEKIENKSVQTSPDGAIISLPSIPNVPKRDKTHKKCKTNHGGYHYFHSQVSTKKLLQNGRRPPGLAERQPRQKMWPHRTRNRSKKNLKEENAADSSGNDRCKARAIFHGLPVLPFKGDVTKIELNNIRTGSA